ncbi:hypothetical protein TNCT_586251, partial [Trichonephila clavata]
SGQKNASPSDPTLVHRQHSTGEVINLNTRWVIPQRPESSHHHPSFSLQRPTMYPRNQPVFQQRPAALRPDASTFHPSQRTQENNTVFQPHRT